MKKFKDLKKSEQVYVVEPFTTNILECEVMLAAVHPKSKNRRVWVIDFLRTFRLKGLDPEKLKMLKEEYGADTTMRIMVDGEQDFMSILVPPKKHGDKPSITVISTEYQKLEKWVQKEGKETAELLKELKNLA